MERHCEEGGGRLEVRIQAGKVMDGVKLRPIFFYSEIGGKPDMWAPYLRSMHGGANQHNGHTVLIGQWPKMMRTVGISCLG